MTLEDEHQQMIDHAQLQLSLKRKQSCQIIIKEIIDRGLVVQKSKSGMMTLSTNLSNPTKQYVASTNVVGNLQFRHFPFV